jgi:hypothetical protein
MIDSITAGTSSGRGHICTHVPLSLRASHSDLGAHLTVAKSWHGVSYLIKSVRNC